MNGYLGRNELPNLEEAVMIGNGGSFDEDRLSRQNPWMEYQALGSIFLTICFSL